MKKKFSALKALSTVLKILSIVVAALAVIGGLITFIASITDGNIFSSFGFDATGGALAGLFSGFVMILAGALYGLILYGYSELIILLMSMEDNTSRTVKLLEEVIREDKPE